MKIDRIETRRMDFGVGVLRGVLSRPGIPFTAPQEVEEAITHIRAAARAIARLQRTIVKPRPRCRR